MFDKLKGLLLGMRGVGVSLAVNRKGAKVSQEIIEAVVRILIEMTRTDNDVAAAEAQELVAILKSQFKENEELIPALVESVLARTEKASSMDAVFALLNATYSEKQKVSLLALCWRVVLADGHVDRAERRFALQLRNRFQLSEEQDAEAQRLAREE